MINNYMENLKEIEKEVKEYSEIDELPGLLIEEHIKIIDVESGKVLINSRC